MPDDARSIVAADLYEVDYVAWAEAQAAALLARRADSLDWEQLADEVASLARIDYHACYSFISLIVEHLLKLEFVGSPSDGPHWRGEIVNFRRLLAKRLTPTLTNRLRAELIDIYETQLRALSKRELLTDLDFVRGRRPEGYSWDEVLDAAFFPDLLAAP